MGRSRVTGKEKYKYYPRALHEVFLIWNKLVFILQAHLTKSALVIVRPYFPQTDTENYTELITRNLERHRHRH